MMQQLIETMVKALVDQPEQVCVREVCGDDGTSTFEVRVAPGDAGQIIGKQGRLANAVRTLAKASAMKHKRKIYVEIIA